MPPKKGVNKFNKQAKAPAEKECKMPKVKCDRCKKKVVNLKRHYLLVCPDPKFTAS